MPDKYIQPDLERILQMNDWSEAAFMQIQALMRQISPMEALEVKGRLQVITDELINSWRDLVEKGFDDLVIPRIKPGVSVDDLLPIVQPSLHYLQEMATQLLISYSFDFADAIDADHLGKQLLENFVTINGLVGVWRLMILVKLVSPLPTDKLHLSTVSLQLRLSHMRMRLHLDFAHYVEETIKFGKSES